MPPEDDLIRLYHIWEATIEALGYAQDRRRADLDADRPLQHSLVRLLAIIGEAAATVSQDFRSRHPDIPWRAMVGMRNRLIHAYFDVNLDVVWRTACEDLPTLAKAVRPVLVHSGLIDSQSTEHLPHQLGVDNRATHPKPG